MKILLLMALGLGSVSAFAGSGHFKIFDPDFKFDCPSEQESDCETPPLRTGDDCKFGLLTNGEASLAARLQTLKIPHIKTIRVQALVFAADECGKYIAQRLLDLKKQHPEIRIQVIVDALSNLFPGGDSATAVKLSAQTQEMYNFLESSGIQVKGDPRQLTDDATSARNIAILNKRFHDKMWIVNGEDPDGVAITGGMNIACDYFRMGPGPKHTWRDQDTMQKGRIVGDITRTFDNNFRYFEELEQTRASCFQNPKLMGAWNKWVDFYHHKVVEPLEKVNDITKRIAQLDKRGAPIDQNLEGATCRFIQNRPRFKEQYIRSAYLDMINNSDGEIRIANAYFIPTDTVINALKEAARHGRKIKILTNSYETNDLNQMTFASRALYKTLMEVNADPETQKAGGGIRIFEWQGHKPGEAQTDGTIHAKYAVGDCEDVIDGSYNLDPRSENLNSETIMDVQTRKRGRELCDQFDHQDLGKAAEITWDQAVEWNDPQKLKDGINLELSERFKGQF